MSESDSNTSRTKIVPISLRERNVSTIRNWHEFLTLWNEATTLEQMLGLLHKGFSVSLEPQAFTEPKYDEIDRLEFYLANADGWANSYSLRTLADEGWRCRIDGFEKSQSEVRQIVARMAFDVLCQHFFKKWSEIGLRDNHERLRPEWVHFIASERLLSAIRRFFQPIEGGTSLRDTEVGIHNLDRQPQQQVPLEKHAIAFLVRLKQFVWLWEEDTVWMGTLNPQDVMQKDAVMRARIEAAKPWMVEVLVALDSLDLLWEVCGPRSYDFLELEESCAAKLKEIALRKVFDPFHHPVTRNRKAVTLDEARLAGSKAAWFLEEYDVKKKGWEKLKAIQRAERVAEEAARNLEKLTTG